MNQRNKPCEFILDGTWWKEKFHLLEKTEERRDITYCQFKGEDIYHVGFFGLACCNKATEAIVEKHPALEERPSPEVQLCPDCKDSLGLITSLAITLKEDGRRRAARRARKSAWSLIPASKITAAKHDVVYNGARVLSEVPDPHQLKLLLSYLSNYERNHPDRFSQIYWVEQNMPYTAWAHYIKGRKAYFHRPGREEYLHSPEWEERRQLTLRRDNYHCTVCGTDSSLTIHHKTYEHFGNEPSEDLVTVCTTCHARIHTQASFKSFFPLYPSYNESNQSD